MTTAPHPHPLPSEFIAGAIVKPYVGKRLGIKDSQTLTQRIAEFVTARIAAMLSYAPQEIERIAKIAALTAEQVEYVLRAAGGTCVDEDTATQRWQYDLSNPQERNLLGEAREKITNDVRMLLHASRDGMRNNAIDTKKQSFNMHADGGYYNEAFGMMRTLVTLGYGYFGASNSNDPANLKAVFASIEQRVLEEEGWFDKTHRCSYCLERYGKDTSGKKSIDA